MQLELRGITKRFGSLTANDHISLTVEPGQIHSLLGENGAGKSTLMNVLFGLLSPDEGEILIDGVVAPIHDSGDAVRRGIGMVHQHFMLVPVFTVPRMWSSDSNRPSHSIGLTTNAPRRRFANFPNASN